MSWTHLSDTLPAARRDRRCDMCGRVIPSGERHVKRVGVYDREFMEFRMHRLCEAVSTKADSGRDDDCWDTFDFRDYMERLDPVTLLKIRLSLDQKVTP